MKKLDWYIIKKFLGAYLFVVLCLLAIICAIDFTDKNDDFIENDVPGKLIGMYYLTFIPFIASLITPITIFIASILVTSQLAVRTELIAILASGTSFLRIMRPYVAASMFLGLLSFFLNSYIIPDTNKFRINFEIDYLGKPYYFSDRDIHIRIGPSSYIYMGHYNNTRDIGYKVTIETIDGLKLLEKLKASRIEWDTVTSKWKLMKWQKRTILEGFETFENGNQLDTLLNLSPEDFENKERMWETLTMPELNSYINLQKSRGADDVRFYQIEKYIRYMQPFGVTILTLIGLIVSSRKSRSGTGFQVALGLLIAFIYVLFYFFSRAIAEANAGNPILAVWFPNILFSLVGIVLYKTVQK